MAQIGTFIRGEDGSYTGTIRTLSLNIKVRFVPAEPSQNEKAPDLRVLAGNNVEIGAAWKRTSKESTVYHSVKLDDPSFPAPIYANLVAVDDGYALVWSRMNGVAQLIISCFSCGCLFRWTGLQGATQKGPVMAPLDRSDAHGTGMPALNSVIAEEVLIPPRPGITEATPAGLPPAYRILITDQTDPYDTPVSAAEATAIAPAGDNFGGNDRKAAKLSIAKAKAESFVDLKDLIATLVSDAKMIGHHPPITKDATSGRVQEENRNVHVRAFLYAASRENDNDFHLILGRDPESSPMYMTMEISGLPPKNSPSFAQIKHARNAYKQFFGTKLPGPSYHFYRPPIPVEIAGSLFFDITHATGGHPGPKDLRPHIPTIWEVHPVSDIVFEP